VCYGEPTVSEFGAMATLHDAQQKSAKLGDLVPSDRPFPYQCPPGPSE
jgi:hypothetical protein